VLFFDELDSIAKSRGGNVGDGGQFICWVGTALIIYVTLACLLTNLGNLYILKEYSDDKFSNLVIDCVCRWSCRSCYQPGAYRNGWNVIKEKCFYYWSN
jgi:hypothetical protein